ncbi:hypothetical protein CURTO8I2_150039 [Curtobacterium sp. 8I-2]|nr:hypothetical protein CURTO8I2_150039 [Curtobacterium sp. 8I-2]
MFCRSPPTPTTRRPTGWKHERRNPGAAAAARTDQPRARVRRPVTDRAARVRVGNGARRGAERPGRRHPGAER